MPRTPRTPPPYRLHKPSGRAVATFSGRVHYLGKFNSPGSRAKYAAFLAEWNAAGQQLPRRDGTLTVAQLCVAFLKHAEAFYCRPEGTPTGEAENLRFALRPHIVWIAMAQAKMGERDSNFVSVRWETTTGIKTAFQRCTEFQQGSLMRRAEPERADEASARRKKGAELHDKAGL